MEQEKHRAAALIGTSGWVYPHWRGVVYPVGLPTSGWLGFYVTRFGTVELNNSFYRLPSEAAFRRWREVAPVGFQYSVKVNRYITHMKKLAGVEQALSAFLERARLLGTHLGPLLYQLPPQWHANIGRLREFLELLPRDLAHVVEFRHPSWLQDDVLALLEARGIALCVCNLPELECPVLATAPFAYIRLHGSTAKYASSYSEQELRWWAEQVLGFLGDGRDVYVYFDNDACGYAVENAHRLEELLGARQ